MKITRELLRQWDACYDDEKLASLVPEAGLTPLEVAALDIPEKDRMWVLLREDVIPARALRLLACGWAEAACLKTGWNDERSLNAIAVARRFAGGEATKSELGQAKAAALEAALRQAASAAWSAASAAAWAASAAAWASAASAAAVAAAGNTFQTTKKKITKSDLPFYLTRYTW